jgi:ABC-type bacteriocin/lantibiotic exporter with double-glycine peptidase domain
VRRAGALFLIAALFAGCAAAPKTLALIRVPRTRQARDYTCGAAVTQSILGYWGEDMNEGEVAVAIHSDPEVGTPPHTMITFLESKGFTVREHHGMSLADLERLLDAKKPVMLLIQAWPGAEAKAHDWKNDWDDGHWVVAVGYDAANVYFMDPSTLGNYTYIKKPEFLDRWHDTDPPIKYVHYGLVAERGSPRFSEEELLPMK